MDNVTSQSTRIFKTGYVLNNKWVIIEFIGKGAMGEVYRAHQLNLKRDVAIKVISQEMLESFENDPEEIETALQRFRREVQAMARVRHPKVLQIFDYGSAVIHKDNHDIPVEYIAMEFIPGATLRFTMSEEGFYPEQDLIEAWLSDYFLPLLEGVEAIHAGNIAHRDIKPENVLMDGKTPKIADFGLACSLCLKPVTQSLDVKGTPAYMSPEHFFSFKNADQQSDIYSLGKILYEAIDGKITSKVLPFKGATLSNPDTPFLQKLNQTIQDATAEKKEDRLKSVRDLRTAILEALNILKSQSQPDTPTSAKPPPLLYQPRFIWAGIIIAVLSVGLMTIWHLMYKPEEVSYPLKTNQTAHTESSKQPPPVSPKVEPTSSTTTTRSVIGKDGIKMLFVPGGEMKVDIEGLNVQGQTVQIKPFYIDENMVTNHHFAEFLNEVKKNLTIENGLVKHHNEIWFYLGKGTEPYENIFYKHDRFHLRNAEYAAQPVVRVTWYGALAYARHYGKRLITEFEWDYVVLKNSGRRKISSTSKTYTPQSSQEKLPVATETHTHMMDMDAQHDKMIEPNPSLKLNSTDNAHEQISSDDLTGLKDMGGDFKEWVMLENTDLKNRKEAENKEDILYSSLIVGKQIQHGANLKSFKYPWEAFPDVGFRCVSSLGNEE